jgi:hypothetical protein
MTQHTKWIATAAAVATALTFASSAQAQAVTGDATLDNITPTEAYGGWGPPAIITSIPGTGLDVAAFSGGSAYFAIPTANQQILNPADTQVSLTFTINSPAGWDSPTPVTSGGTGCWIGTPFTLNDNAEAGTQYGGYVGTFAPGSGVDTSGTPCVFTVNGNTVTETAQLDAGQLAAVQTGTDVISGFNLEFYPAVGASVYDVTFNSLVLSGTVPEPSTLGLIGAGVAGLLAFRRRIK